MRKQIIGLRGGVDSADCSAVSDPNDCSGGGGGGDILMFEQDLDCSTGELTISWNNLWQTYYGSNDIGYSYPIEIINTDTGSSILTREYSSAYDDGVESISDGRISVTYDISTEDLNFDSSNSSYSVDISAYDFNSWDWLVATPHTYPPEPDEITASYSSGVLDSDYKIYDCAIEDVSCLQGYDQCGVCGGDNSTCTDCAGVVNGNSVIDVCGDCTTTPETDPDQCEPQFTLTVTAGSCVTNDEDTMYLTWTDMGGNPEGYVIERDGTQIDTVNATTTYVDILSESDPNYSPNKTYSYVVYPYYESGNGLAGYDTATTPSACDGSGISITNLDQQGLCGSEKIVVSWTDMTGEDGYYLYRDENLIKTLSESSTTTDDNFDDGFDTFSPNTEYTYQVAVYYDDGTTVTTATSTPVSIISEDVCTTENNICGSLNNTTQLTKPSGSNLCSLGTESSVTADSTSRDWEWTCTDGETVSQCSANVQVGCGDAAGFPTDTAPTTDLCITGNSTSTDVGTSGTQWIWECRNDSAFSDNVEITTQCGAENTDGVFIKDFNLNPRIVPAPEEVCTINYTIETSSATSTNCLLQDTSGATTSLPFTSGVEQSYSTDVNPGKSYRISCVYDDGVDPPIEKETGYLSCNLNPSFSEF
ncbi:hypothetical protein GW764_02835 [Candidatus Parcubacteria bacterium]|nr:hypothetical protein [Candidatus Parcubacteria bacterium]